MPLSQGKSKKSFSKNVETEMNAGKPQKQALAIAYSVKRQNKAKGGSVRNVNQKLRPHSGEKDSMKKDKCPGCGMAYHYGGMIPSEDNNFVAQDHLDQLKGLEDGPHDEHEDKMRASEKGIAMHTGSESSNDAGGQYEINRARLERMYGKMANGGMVEGPSPKDQEDRAGSDKQIAMRDRYAPSAQHEAMKEGDEQIQEGPSPKDQEDRAGSRVQQVMRDRYALGGYVQPKNVNDQDGDEDSLDRKTQRDSGDDLYNDLGLTDTYPQFDKEESDTMAQDQDEVSKRKRKARIGQIFEQEYDHSK